MSNPSPDHARPDHVRPDLLRTVLGPNLQMGALRAIILLGAFAFVGASLAWLIH